MPAKLQGKQHSNGAAADSVGTAPASDAVLSAHEVSVGETELKLWGDLPAGEAGAALHVSHAGQAAGQILQMWLFSHGREPWSV